MNINKYRVNWSLFLNHGQAQRLKRQERCWGYNNNHSKIHLLPIDGYFYTTAKQDQVECVACKHRTSVFIFTEPDGRHPRLTFGNEYVVYPICYFCITKNIPVFFEYF